jgi:hypothetical protein
MPFPCPQVRRSARTNAAAPVRTLLGSAMRLLITIAISNASNRGIIFGMHGDLAAISELSPDHPVGPNGTYRSAQSWIEPAVANNSSAKNIDAIEAARAPVVLITNETSSQEPEDR